MTTKRFYKEPLSSLKTYYQELETVDKQCLWHPFTQMQEYVKQDPLIIVAGEGNYLIDIQGKRYLDGVSSLWVNVHGHNHPDINEAIISQVGRISHSTLLGTTNIPAIELSRRLVEITPPGLTKVFYSECGATSVEIGLKLAFQYWQQRDNPRPKKIKFAYLQNSYHGDTLGSVSVGGIELFHNLYQPLLPEHVCVPSPYCYRCFLSKNPDDCEMACFENVLSIVEARHEELAAFIIEPLVQGAAGMIVAPEGYLKKIREICDRFDILLIADEVAVGFGKTGRMFACEHESVSPDIMTMGKGITGGYLPLAATLATDEIYEAFLGKQEEFKTFFHGHTYTGNPVTCAAALANLDIFEKEQTMVHLQGKVTRLQELLTRCKSLKHVGDIRQKGFMVGIELVSDTKTKESYPYEEKVGIRVIQEARKHGLVIRPLGDVIVLMPPLSTTEDQLREIVDITVAAIKTVTEG
ncbi:MAG: adenosylmethionine--8-amino-7-oxononanoate transaminase [Deltaproteobacteria bacterium]|nr:adenosylmethionine--8-amino-7-oxononanoate transaminase [Deltaproteobacteria bacterium]